MCQIVAILTARAGLAPIVEPALAKVVVAVTVMGMQPVSVAANRQVMVEVATVGGVVAAIDQRQRGVAPLKQ